MDATNQDSRPRPDPTALTTAQLDREIRHLKELMERDRDVAAEALKVALAQMERRLEELNELRKAVETDRNQFVRFEVYHPAHEELRRQRAADSERITINSNDIKTTATDLAELKASMMWLTRLVIGALVVVIIGYAFNRLMGR